MTIEDSAGEAKDGQEPAGASERQSISMEQALGRLQAIRVNDQDSSLSSLLDSDQQSQEYLIDLACVDLINRRRAGKDVTAQDYIDDLPNLASKDDHLDLIDSELCVDREQVSLRSLQNYLDRYPKFAAEIAELFDLPSPPSGHAGLVELDRPALPALDQSNRSLDFSIVENQTGEKPHVQDELDVPVEVPDWFTAKQCIASGPGYWLLRGRDSSRGETLAMKIMRLPSQVTVTQIDGLLEACERAAKVASPAWVGPAIAAVQHKHIAIVRPWVFGTSWNGQQSDKDVGQKIRGLASVAYGLQAAHRLQAAHGSVSAGNLFFDHEGKIKIVDCVSSSSGVMRWLQESPDQSLCPWGDQQAMDIQDLLGLIANTSVSWPRVWAEKLLPELRATAGRHDDEACGQIGDFLMKWSDQNFADAPKDKPASWRSRLAKWIEGQN